jgi:rare lipoprotein A
LKKTLLAAAFVLAATTTHAHSKVLASWYGSPQPTASGERFNPNAMTAAHRTLPFGTRVEVCHRGCVVVRINDRGPYIRGRSIDLSRGAARAIGMTDVGVASVTMRVL